MNINIYNIILGGGDVEWISRPRRIRQQSITLIIELIYSLKNYWYRADFSPTLGFQFGCCVASDDEAYKLFRLWYSACGNPQPQEYHRISSFEYHHGLSELQSRQWDERTVWSLTVFLFFHLSMTGRVVMLCCWQFYVACIKYRYFIHLIDSIH